MKRHLAFAVYFVLAIMGLLGGSLLTGRSAPGATLKTFQFLGWSVSARSNDQTRQLDRCSAQTTYPNGVTLAFSVDRRYSWSLALSNPGWHFVDATTFSIVLPLIHPQFLNHP